MKFLVLFMSIFLLSGCVTKSPQSVISAPPVILPKQDVSLKKLCEKHKAVWTWDSVSKVVEIDFLEVNVRVLIGSAVVLVNEYPVLLSRSVKMEKSIVYVPSDFETKVLNTQKGKSFNKNIKYIKREINYIVLDAGHGGKDPGAIGRSGLQEKRVVLDITKKVKKILEEQGLKVIMTRDKDRFISLQRRTEIASRPEVDLFVSIHANSSPARSVQGVEIFILKNLSALEKREDQRKKNYQRLFKRMQMKKDVVVQNIVKELLYENKQVESKRLAVSVGRHMAKTSRVKIRGVKESRFFVLRNTLVPSILVEVGFLTNPKEERLLKTKAYRQKLALGLAKSILDYAQGRF